MSEQASEPMIMPVMVADHPLPRFGERADRIRELSMRYPELSQGAIARRVGCSVQNVSQVLASFLEDHTHEQLQDFQGNKADIYDAIGYKALASLTQEKLDKASALQLMTVAAIAEDKTRLVRGQPTSLHVTALLDVAQMIRERRDKGELSRQTDPPNGDSCE